MDAQPDNRREGARILGCDITRRALGDVFGARSGDKGPDADVGVWARNGDAYAWLWPRTSVSTCA